MRRDVQAVVLVLVGGAVVRVVLSGTYTNYVKPGFGWVLLVAGVLVVGLGLWSAVRDGVFREPADAPRPTPAAEQPQTSASSAGSPTGAVEAAEDGDAGHDHEHGPRVAWLLLLPVFTLFLVAPPALGAYAADLEDVSVVEPADAAFPALPAGDPVDLAVADYAVRAVWDEGRSLSGRTVRMTGFVTPRGDGGWDLTRMQLACCAADARATRIEAQGAPDLPADTWVEVVGRWVPGGDVMTDDAVPVLEVESVREVSQPANPYE